jgi:hypothetical protein
MQIGTIGYLWVNTLVYLLYYQNEMMGYLSSFERVLGQSTNPQNENPASLINYLIVLKLEIQQWTMLAGLLWIFSDWSANSPERKKDENGRTKFKNNLLFNNQIYNGKNICASDQYLQLR